MTQLPTTTIASTTELTTAANTTLGEAQTTTVVMESSTPITVEPTDSEATVNEPTSDYIFNGEFSTVTMSQSASTSQDQPQISLTVEMAVQTTEGSTTTQLPTTTIASTTELTTSELATAEPLPTANITTGEGQTTVTAQATTIATEPSTTGVNRDTSVITIATPVIVRTTNNAAATSPAAISTTLPGPVTSVSSHSYVPVGLIVGAVFGGVIVLVLLAVVILLTLTVLHLTRKYKKVVRGGAGERESDRSERVIDRSRTVNTVSIQLRVNDAYALHDSKHNLTADDHVSEVVYDTIDASLELQVTRNKAYITSLRQSSTEAAAKRNNDHEDFYISDDHYDYIST